MPTIITSAIVALIVFFAIRKIIRDKRKGGTCAGCQYADKCDKKENKKGCER